VTETQETVPARLNPAQREDLLRRSWMANDGLWFYHTAQASGIDAANERNIVVVREFGRQEMRRLMRALDIREVTNLDQYQRLFDTAVELFLGPLIQLTDTYSSAAHEISVSSCFAFTGVRRAGIEKVYHCGPGERLLGWLEAMELGSTVVPEVGLCQMAHTGSCGYRVEVDAPWFRLAEES